MKTITKNGVTFHQSSDNIFADFGFPNAEEELAKSNLAIQVIRIINKRKLTQEQAAEIIGVSQPVVSRIKNGRLDRISIGKLTECLIALDHNIEIRVKPKKKSEPAAHYTVVGS